MKRLSLNAAFKPLNTPPPHLIFDNRSYYSLTPHALVVPLPAKKSKMMSPSLVDNSINRLMSFVGLGFEKILSSLELLNKIFNSLVAS